VSVDLARIEAVVDRSGIAPVLEVLLPVGVRPRQLCVRTLLVGMAMCQAEGRPAHLRRVHRCLLSLPDPDRRRLGVDADWRNGPHRLTYRQVERTFSLVVGALGKDEPNGAPSEVLQSVADAVVEASVEGHFKKGSTSLAIDWTDVESFSTRRTKPSGHYADTEASWGHRKGGGPGEKDELFFGYYLSLSTMVSDDPGGRDTPELVRRMNLVGCHHDPVPAMVSVLVGLPEAGIPLGDVVADSGYAHRLPTHFALPLRAARASLVMDLHPNDRGTQGTHAGAVLHHGNLYCPMTPAGLFGQAPLPRGASHEEAAAHDARAAELARYKLGRVSATDADGYHRRMCPALLGKVRCPLRPGSMVLALTRPEVLDPPEHPPACCTQHTITVPPTVTAKTAQRHDYPSKAWRRSYARRSAAERANARIKDPATIDIARGWCRTMGLTPMTLWLATAIAVRNLAVTDAFCARQEEDRRRAKAGQPPRTRRRRRTTLGDLAEASAGTPP
jgi:hypothetical protein